MSGQNLDLGPIGGSDEFTVGAGGQTAFTTSGAIGSSYTLFEDGIISARSSRKTAANVVTTPSTVPEGTIVNILY